MTYKHANAIDKNMTGGNWDQCNYKNKNCTTGQVKFNNIFKFRPKRHR